MIPGEEEILVSKEEYEEKKDKYLKLSGELEFLRVQQTTLLGEKRKLEEENFTLQSNKKQRDEELLELVDKVNTRILKG